MGIEEPNPQFLPNPLYIDDSIEKPSDRDLFTFNRRYLLVLALALSETRNTSKIKAQTIPVRHQTLESTPLLRSVRYLQELFRSGDILCHCLDCHTIRYLPRFFNTGHSYPMGCTLTLIKVSSYAFDSANRTKPLRLSPSMGQQSANKSKLA